MITSTVFKKSIIFSVIGHFSVFSLISLNFGKGIQSADSFAPVVFWGDLPASYNLAKDYIGNVNAIKSLFSQKTQAQTIARIQDLPFSRPQGYMKPPLVYGFQAEKNTYVKKTAPERFVRKARESSIVFHPVLPYDFTFYFRDKKIAHVELSFNIISSENRSLIDIKRKITSGNPEVDLLTMRYMSHYLSMQQTRFSLDNWETVKIDLSSKK